jgi:endonuclease/exonuclease/phosphatase (EEP) superfamily protein YafD
MFCAPRPHPPIAPQVATGVPDRPLRFLAYNLYHNYRGTSGTVAAIQSLQPAADFVMMEELEAEHIGPMSSALGLPYVYHPRMYPQKPPIQNWPGIALLSRHPLYAARPLRTADGATFGVWAYAVVDGKKFAVAGVHLRATTGASPSHVMEMNRIRKDQLQVLNDTWRKEGTPPLVVGGDFNQPAMGDNYALMTRDFTDVLLSLGKDYVTHRWAILETRIDYLLCTSDWKPTEGGVIEGEASDHRPVWAELTKRRPPATAALSPATGPRPN